MKYAYSFSEIKAAEERGPSVECLMERAGAALAARVEEVLAARGVSDCVFVLGGGNNGGNQW